MQGSKGGRRGISIFELLKTAILLALVAMVVMMGLRIGRTYPVDHGALYRGD